MDPNNNSIHLKSSNSVQVSFTNEIEVNMQLPNQDSKSAFNKFNHKEFKPFNPQAGEMIKKKSSFIEPTQNQLLECHEQFNLLIRNQCRELGVDFDSKLRKFKLDPNLVDKISSQQLKNKHMTTFELDAYVFSLILFTENKLKQFSDSSNQAILKDLKKNSNSELNKSVELKEKHDLIDYFKILSLDKLIIYRDKLEQTIKKLNDDLVNLLEERDEIYLKRDELIKQVESLTKSSLQVIDDFDDNPTV